MSYGALFATLILLLLPESASACPKHGTHWDIPSLTASLALLSKMAFSLVIAVPLGFGAGKMVRGRFTAGRALTVGLVTSGVLLGAGSNSWACHGKEIAGPVLEKIHAAQLEYRARHGVFAPTFAELGITLPATDYALFLPAQTLPPANPLPRPGIDLTRLPSGVHPLVSADRFTVVALGFSEPDRIDVWTMDQTKTFREWSLPAVQKGKAESRVDQPSSLDGASTGLIGHVEGPALVMTLLFGMAAGFALGFRVPALSRAARP
jgi:hypothetical protein